MRRLIIFALLTLWSTTFLTAQRTSDFEKRMQDYTTDYLSKHVNDQEIESLIKNFEKDGNRTLDKNEILDFKKELAKSEFLHQNYKEYLQLYVQKSGTRAAGNVCENGSFEDDFNTYEGWLSNFTLGSGTCDPTLNNLPIAYFSEPLPSNKRFEIVSNTADPLVGINMVHSGSKAARINARYSPTGGQCDGNREVNRLVKNFMVTEENRNFTVWYAVVLENPPGHNDQQPFLNINCDLAPLDEVCFDADFLTTQLIYPDDSCSFQNIDVLDYTCASFRIPKDKIGEMASLEMIVADCGAGAHFGYAYIDAICEPCIGGSTGSIHLDNPAPCEGFPVKVCGSYTLPTVAGNWTPSINIPNIAFQNLVINPDQTFCFEVTDANFQNVDCIDVSAEITFTSGGNTIPSQASNVIDLCLNEIKCDCIDAKISNIKCFDNGTADPSDDYWTFDILVTDISGNGTYWTTDPNIASGAYGVPQTIYPGSISGVPTISFTVYEASNPKCAIDLTVNAPTACSEKCKLEVKYEISGCKDNGTSDLISDDYYYVTVHISGTNGQPWMIKQKLTDPYPGDPGEYLIASGVGDTTIILGPFLIQTGDWTMWVFLSDYFDCLVDFYIKAPDYCSGCLDVDISNIQCFDNGTEDPSDDYWTFDILVSGGNNYWYTNGDITEAGPYNVVKTIYAGSIKDCLEFKVHDDLKPDCITRVIVCPPKPCSKKCKLEVKSRIKCEYDPRTGAYFYFVDLSVTGTSGACWMAKKKNQDGSEELLGTFYGDQSVHLGPFTPGQDWTLWVMLCEQFDCVRDLYIQSPDCRRDGGLRSSPSDSQDDISMMVMPNPVSNNEFTIVSNAIGISYQISDVQNRVLYSATLQNAAETIRLDLAAGVYYLQYKDENGLLKTIKFIKL